MTAQAFAGLRFTEELLKCPARTGASVLATLRHFAIVTYAVPVERVRPHVHPAFDLDAYPGPDGRLMVWVSVVPFEDQDFRFVAAPWATFRFGQTNYRTYVVDRATGERAAWFFGTTLDSWSVLVPQLLWRLPWYRGRMRFDCEYDETAARYTAYRVQTRSAWGAMELELEDSGQPVAALPQVEDLEGGLVALTHPVKGVYYRRDGHLGTYTISHDRLDCRVGRIRRAHFAVLDRLGLVPWAEQEHAHSVLIQRQTEFTIYLPPGRFTPASAQL